MSRRYVTITADTHGGKKTRNWDSAERSKDLESLSRPLDEIPQDSTCITFVRERMERQAKKAVTGRGA